jgi:hypothetical protein
MKIAQNWQYRYYKVSETYVRNVLSCGMCRGRAVAVVDAARQASPVPGFSLDWRGETFDTARNLGLRRQATIFRRRRGYC